MQDSGIHRTLGPYIVKLWSNGWNLKANFCAYHILCLRSVFKFFGLQAVKNQPKLGETKCKTYASYVFSRGCCQIPINPGHQLLIITGIFLVLTCAIIVVLVNYTVRQQALVEAESKMSIMAEQYLSIHTYFSQKLKPVVFELTDAIRPKTYFDPVWMSSTYAIREINKTIKKSKGETEYYLKDAAINARSPENEATPYEKEFLAELGVNPKLKEKSIVQMIDGRPYLVLLRRGEVMEASCLRCHSSPDKAPADMVRLYGPKRSFNRKIGDWVQAVSIRVPLAEAYANANHFSLRLSALLLTLLFVLFGLLYFFSRRLMFKPLSVIHEKALEISTDEKKLGDEIPLPSGRELNELASAFNSMSKSLRYHMDNLETLVKERTLELTKTNEDLEIEIAARKKSEQELRESQGKFKSLFDNMNSGVAVYTADNNGKDFIFHDLNKAGEQIDKINKEKIIGRSVSGDVSCHKGFWSLRCIPASLENS